MAENNTSSISLLETQVKRLFNTTMSGGISNIAASLLVYLLLSGDNLQVQAMYIAFGIALFSIARIIVAKHYLSNKQQLNFHLNIHIGLTFLIGACWGAIAFLQIYNHNETVRNIIFLINFGLMAASIATLSFSMKSYLAYMVPQSASIFYVFLQQDSTYSLYMVLCYSIFITIMMVTSLRFNKNFKKEIELTLNNKQLISDLNNEIGIRERVQLELEQNKLDLENKVNDRTRELIDINLNLEKVIAKKEEAEESLQHLAYHDELTGLPNKNLLVDRITQSIKKSSRDEQQMAILFLDLDRFKNINDSLGHTIGDTLLKEVASRLHKTLRRHDTISRNGGDEFVVVLERLKNSNEAIHVAKKVINCLTETFVIHSHKIHIGASIGISIYPGDGESPLVLLRNADTAMYRAKQTGGNQLQFYDKSMSNQLRDRLELENELHTALENNEFSLVYQPQVDCVTGMTTGFESLIRWDNKKYGAIPPDRFVPLLEETGLIYSVGEWIVRQVISFVKQHPLHGVRFSINLSVLQCNNMQFIEFVRYEIDKAGIDPSQIEFEITESLLIKDFEKTERFLNELHHIGCSIALDDFGTGYTSMNYLARLPIDVIKIDKSLIRNIDKNQNLQSIVRAIVTMSKSLGLTNVFEGIETNAELMVVKGLQGKVIQGYLFSVPLSEADVERWVSSDRPISAVN